MADTEIAPPTAPAAAGFVRIRFRPRRDRSGQVPYVSIAVLGLFALVAILAPLISPHPPTAINVGNALAPPFWSKHGTWTYALGSDKLGRDILSRVIFGTRPALIVAVASVAIAAVVGSALGIIAAYFGGVVDQIVMRLVDIMLSFPALLLALLLAARFGPGIRNVILVISLIMWASYARQVRTAGMVVMKHEYVTLARSGGRGLGIMPLHLLPNVINTIIVMATLQLGIVVILEALLSFVGVGVPPPNPTWGGMISDGRGLVGSSWWLSVFPGLAILLLVLAVNIVGEWLEVFLDPRRRDR